MDKLQQVQEFARLAHGDQMRKFEPESYITHLIRVKDLVAQYNKDESILAAALLHDVLEDTSVKREEIYQFLEELMGAESSRRTLDIVVELTDIFIKSNFPQWNRRKRKIKEAERLGKTSTAAQTIKYADIIDNSLTIVNAGDDFVKTYLREAKALLQAMANGHPDLRQRAMDTVEECMVNASLK